MSSTDTEQLIAVSDSGDRYTLVSVTTVDGEVGIQSVNGQRALTNDVTYGEPIAPYGPRWPSAADDWLPTTPDDIGKVVIMTDHVGGYELGRLKEMAYESRDVAGMTVSKLDDPSFSRVFPIRPENRLGEWTRLVPTSLDKKELVQLFQGQKVEQQQAYTQMRRASLAQSIRVE
jgi:hypothetical protein